MSSEIFEPVGFSKTIFTERYALTPEETWQEACRRLARQMAMAEVPEKMRFYEDKFFDVIACNRFVPGGRIWFQSGKNNPALLNCFVLTNQLDSKEGWGNIAKEMIVTSMAGGGCGIDYSDVRPDGALIFSNKGICPGPVALMQLVDNCAEPVRSGGGRRVALMFSLDLEHPDVEAFLDAKLVKGKLSHANVSVKTRKTSEFIKAIKKDEDFELSWKGKYKKTVKARQLWNRIVQNAYMTAEPGFLNWELVLSESNIYYISELATTNPCGEQPLSPYDCCCLGHLVLHRFVKPDGTFDYEECGKAIRLAVRFLDNVLSVNNYPLPEMRDTSHKLRRIGLGVTGLADMLALLGLRYGSEEGNKFVDKLYRFISKQAYEASVMLAIEKGPFPLCNPEKHIESGYMKRMTPKIKSLILEHGIRNCTLLTVAPTGTVSILSGNCSSGIEPMFAPAYERRYWKDSERQTELVFHPLFRQFMDESRDVSHFVASQELSVREHLEVQRIVQHHVDSAVSKTINMSEDYPIEDMNKIWLEYLPHLKGVTFYRDKSRGYVNDKGGVEPPPLTPLLLDEAKNRYHHGDIAIERSEESQCKSGMCSL